MGETQVANRTSACTLCNSYAQMLEVLALAECLELPGMALGESMSHEAGREWGQRAQAGLQEVAVAQLQLVVGTGEPGQLFQFLNAGGNPDVCVTYPAGVAS